MGVWRTLGYIYAGLTIVGGFVLVGLGANLSTQTNFQTGPPGLYGNIKIIAEWTQSQKEKEGKSDYDEEQKKRMDKLDNYKFDPFKSTRE